MDTITGGVRGVNEVIDRQWSLLCKSSGQVTNTFTGGVQESHAERRIPVFDGRIVFGVSNVSPTDKTTTTLTGGNRDSNPEHHHRSSVGFDLEVQRTKQQKTAFQAERRSVITHRPRLLP